MGSASRDSGENEIKNFLRNAEESGRRKSMMLHDGLRLEP